MMKKLKAKSFDFWEWIKTTLIKFLKDKAVKSALKMVLGTATGTGIQAWIVKFIATELFEEVAEPIIKGIFRERGYQHEKIKGKITFKKIHDAETVDDWRDAVRDS